MPDHHVLIDTCIYWRDPARNKVGLQAMTRLAEANRIQIHLPHYVYREFLTRQIATLSKDFRNITRLANSVKGRTNNKRVHASIKSILSQSNLVSKHLAASLKKDFDLWISQSGVRLHRGSAAHADYVTDAYFSGADPFSHTKSRKDFPDAFIYVSARDILAEHSKLHAIIGDSNLRKSLGRLCGVSTYSTLEEFLQRDAVQESLRDLDEIDNIDRLNEILLNESEFLHSKLEIEIIEPLCGTTATGNIPDDNNEAVILGVGEARNAFFKFDEIEYYGDGVIGIPFSCIVDCEIMYHIFKQDWYVMSEEESEGISVADCNRHYYEAEETRDIEVDGSLSLRVETEQLRGHGLEREPLKDLIYTANWSVEVYRARIEDRGTEDYY